MRIFVLALIVLLNFILQTTLFRWIAIAGIIPNTALIIVVCYAILRDDTEGALVGFFSGLLQDLLFGRIIGTSAFLMMIIGYFSGKPFRDFFKETYIVPIILVAIAGLSYEFMYYVINFLLQGRTNFMRYLGQIILPTVAYNLIISVFIYRLIYGIDRRLNQREDKRHSFIHKK